MKHWSFATLILLFYCFAVAQSSPVNTVSGRQALFSFKSDASLARLKEIQTKQDEWYRSHRHIVKDGYMGVNDVIRDFWTDNPHDFAFILNQTEKIVVNIKQRLEVEMDLLLSDPETVEDLMEVDVSTILKFLESKPKFLYVFLKHPRCQEIRQALKNHYTNLLMLPLFMRLQGLVFTRKWNNTYASISLFSRFTLQDL